MQSQKVLSIETMHLLGWTIDFMVLFRTVIPMFSPYLLLKLHHNSRLSDLYRTAVCEIVLCPFGSVVPTLQQVARLL